MYEQIFTYLRNPSLQMFDVSNKCFFPLSIHRRTQGEPGAMPPHIFSISSHFVLWEAASQTKYCCSPKIKNFVPPKFFGPLQNFGLAAPLYLSNASLLYSLACLSSVCSVILLLTHIDWRLHCAVLSTSICFLVYCCKALRYGLPAWTIHVNKFTVKMHTINQKQTAKHPYTSARETNSRRFCKQARANRAKNTKTYYSKTQRNVAGDTVSALHSIRKCVYVIAPDRIVDKKMSNNLMFASCADIFTQKQGCKIFTQEPQPNMQT